MTDWTWTCVYCAYQSNADGQLDQALKILNHYQREHVQL